MTNPPSIQSRFHIPFQITLTKGEGQAVAPLSPPLWEPQDQHMLHELGPAADNGVYTNTHRHTKTCLCFGRFSHSSLPAEEIHHCALWRLGGRSNDPPTTTTTTATSLVFGSLGAICICCLTLSSRESKPHEVMWLQLLGEQYDVLPAQIKPMWWFDLICGDSHLSNRCCFNAAAETTQYTWQRWPD